METRNSSIYMQESGSSVASVWWALIVVFSRPKLENLNDRVYQYLYFRMLITTIIVCTLEVTVIPWKTKGFIGEAVPRLYLTQPYLITVTYSDPSFHFMWFCLFPFLQTGFLPNVFKVLSYRPLEFRAFFAYYNAIYNKETGKWKGELTHSWIKSIYLGPALVFLESSVTTSASSSASVISLDSCFISSGSGGGMREREWEWICVPDYIVLAARDSLCRLIM